MVVAVDVNEDEQTAKDYLAVHRRSCHIVLEGHSDLVSAFSPTGFPYYVLIDREGNTAAAVAGGGKSGSDGFWDAPGLAGHPRTRGGAAGSVHPRLRLLIPSPRSSSRSPRVRIRRWPSPGSPRFSCSIAARRLRFAATPSWGACCG